MSKHVNIGAPSTHHRCLWDDNYKGGVGDIYRCPHGKIMYCFQQGGRVDNVWYGSMHSFWFALHPVLTPILYRRAKRALR